MLSFDLTPGCSFFKHPHLYGFCFRQYKPDTIRGERLIDGVAGAGTDAKSVGPKGSPGGRLSDKFELGVAGAGPKGSPGDRLSCMTNSNLEWPGLDRREAPVIG
jgi:hypothetical protein